MIKGKLLNKGKIFLQIILWLRQREKNEGKKRFALYHPL